MPGDNDLMLYIGLCRLCETGPLGLRYCGGCGNVVIMCDECDALWTSADVESKPVLSDEADLPCPTCENSLVGDYSSWATREQCLATPWIADAFAAGQIELKVGTPLALDASNPEDEHDPLDEPIDMGG
ncbi:MAG: hypothetical protein AAGF31_01605 [Planctomycetota bacterium]